MGYQIRVNCPCGKVLKIPDKYAGKKGRCPNCGKKLGIPTLDEIQQKLQQPKEEGEVRNCPTCGAFIQPGDEVCVSCRMNLKTGEWDTEGKSVAKAAPGKIQYVAVSVVCAALILAGIFLVSQLDTSESSATENIAENMAANAAEAKTPLQKELEDLKSRSASSPTASAQDSGEREKRDTVAKELEAAKAQDALESEAREAYQKLFAAISGEENSLRRWSAFRDLRNQYRNTKFIQNLGEKGNPLEDAVAHAKSEKEKLQATFDQGEYRQVLERGVRWLGRSLGGLCAQEELGAELAASAEICHQAALKWRVEPTTGEETPVAESQEDRALLSVKDKVAMFHRESGSNEWLSLYAFYRRQVKNWEFMQLPEQIEPLAKDARNLLQKFPDDPDLARIEELHEESRLLMNFWKSSIAALHSLKGQEINLLLKETCVNRFETGLLTDFDSGKIYLKTKEEPDPKTFTLSELSPRGLGMLVTRVREKNQDLYVELACFYYVNEDCYQTRDYCEKALEKGAEGYAIAKYQKWAMGRIEEETAKQRDSLAKLQAQRDEAVLQQEAQSLARIRENAWKLIETRLIREYQADNTRVVFDLLETLKEDVPRDELIKINRECQQRHGLSLYEISNETMRYCTVCRNSGKIKCAPCRGQGYTEREVKIKTGSSVRKKFCDACGGSGEIYCSHCYHKRHNRRYSMLVEFYDEVD